MTLDGRLSQHFALGWYLFTVYDQASGRPQSS